ncbi:MAG: hypothetical protein KKA84_01415 [Bacteroidetes bacterium]|nr:hypothetical protein [Bacteroidota bacterium]
MLLETLDVRRNDVLIYSQNRFDFEDNFKIVFKKGPDRSPKKTTYFEVCEFIKDTSPKNLIVYRLLTNVESLDAYSTKYGYFVNISGKMELIYFDPIFAIKDLRHLRFNIDPDKFRFKIQQLGITFDKAKDSEPIYKEVYTFDLNASEAQNQNDKIFADAIFVFDDSYHGEVKIQKDPEIVVAKPLNNKEKSPEIEKPERVEPKTFIQKNEGIKKTGQDIVGDGNLNSKGAGIEIEKLEIIEDEVESPKDLNKLSLSPQKDNSTARDKHIDLLKMALGIKEKNENIKQFLEEGEPDSNETANYGETTLLDLFKSTSKSSVLSNREKDSIILKIKNSSTD